MTRCIPDYVKDNEVRTYLCNTDKKEIKRTCLKEQFWVEMKKKTISTYITTDIHFVSMKTGDIVALKMPDATRKGKFYFGVIENDDVEVWDHQRLLSEKWDCEHILSEPWWRTKRIMLRKVKWLRWGLARSLPEQKGNCCTWLCENVPLWLAVDPKEALRIMSGDSFLENTSPSPSFGYYN